MEEDAEADIDSDDDKESHDINLRQSHASSAKLFEDKKGTFTN